jgi:hypothetical protein
MYFYQNKHGRLVALLKLLLTQVHVSFDYPWAPSYSPSLPPYMYSDGAGGILRDLATPWGGGGGGS